MLRHYVLNVLNNWRDSPFGCKMSSKQVMMSNIAESTDEVAATEGKSTFSVLRQLSFKLELEFQFYWSPDLYIFGTWNPQSYEPSNSNCRSAKQAEEVWSCFFPGDLLTVCGLCEVMNSWLEEIHCSLFLINIKSCLPEGEMKRSLSLVFFLARNKVAAPPCEILRREESNEKMHEMQLL